MSSVTTVMGGGECSPCWSMTAEKSMNERKSTNTQKDSATGACFDNRNLPKLLRRRGFSLQRPLLSTTRSCKEERDKEEYGAYQLTRGTNVQGEHSRRRLCS